MTIAEAFQNLYQSLLTVYDAGEAQSIARIVFDDAFGLRNIRRQDRMAPHELHRLGEIQARLLDREPVQYVMGKAHFFGLMFEVGSGLLIPRPETEELVDWILEEETRSELRVLDVGAGSGCIAVTLQRKRPDWEVWALEVEAAALDVARRNAGNLNAPVHFIRGDFLQWRRSTLDLPEAFDLIVSNPPYIGMEEWEALPANVSRYEPRRALIVEGDDPLLFYREIRDFAGAHLGKGGTVYLEVSEYYAREVAGLFGEGWGVEIRKDMQGKERMVRARGNGARLPASAG